MSRNDSFSLANFDDVRPEHVTLRIAPDFERRVLAVEATTRLRVLATTQSIVLDARNLSLAGPVQVRVEPAPAPGAARATAPTADTGVDADADGAHALEPIPGARIEGDRLVVPLGRFVHAGMRLTLRTSTHTSDATSSEALIWGPPDAPGGLPYVFAMCQPINGRQIFPVADRIDARMGWVTTLVAPKAFTSTAVGALRDEQLAGGLRMRTFVERETVPSLFTFLFAGAFVEKPLPGGRLHAVAQRAGMALARRDFRNADGLARDLEARLGTALEAYPRVRLMFMPPGFLWSGLECSSILFNAGLATGDAAGEHVVAHELAHLLGFGGAAGLLGRTMRDAGPLHESFTTFLELDSSDATASGHPPRPSDATPSGVSSAELSQARRLEAIEGALAGDRGRPVVFTPQVEADLDDLWDPARTYEGGALRVAGLRRIVGHAAFDRRLREVFETYREKHATIEEVTERLARDWPATLPFSAATWVDEQFFRPGYPGLSIEWAVAEGALTVTVRQRGTPYHLLLDLLCVGAGGERAPLGCVLDGRAEQRFTFDVKFRPVALLADPAAELVADLDVSTPQDWAAAARAAARGGAVRGLVTSIIRLDPERDADTLAALATGARGRIGRAAAMGQRARAEKTARVLAGYATLSAPGPGAVLEQRQFLHRACEGRPTAEVAPLLAEAALNARVYDVLTTAGRLADRLSSADLSARRPVAPVLAETAGHVFARTTRMQAFRAWALAALRVTDERALARMLQTLVALDAHGAPRVVQPVFDRLVGKVFDRAPAPQRARLGRVAKSMKVRGASATGRVEALRALY